MALIGGIDVSNFLKIKKGERNWNPRYGGERLPFGGLNAAVQIGNGKGKTSIVTASLAVLSRDQTLVRKMKERMAPEKSKVYSHIRVEFIEVDLSTNPKMHMALGEDLPGERVTFGVCGYSNGDLIYYYYPKGLDAAPTYIDQPDGSRELLSNDEVEKAVKSIPGHKWAVKKEAWRPLINHRMPQNVLQRNVAHLKKGAGDKSAEIFTVENKKGVTFDTTFFWQHVAPELLAGQRIHTLNSEENGEENDDHYFEDVIATSSGKLLGASKRVKAREAILKKQEHFLSQITPLESKAKEAVSAIEERDGSLSKVSKRVGLLNHYVNEKPLPGIFHDVSIIVEDDLTKQVLDHIVWVPKSDNLPNGGQAAIWGKMFLKSFSKSGDNDYANRLSNNLGSKYGIPCRYVIESKHNVLPAGERGLLPVYLSESELYTLLASNLGWSTNPSVLKTAVKDAFSIFHEKLDSNPFRKNIKQKQKRKNELDTSIAEKEKQIKVNEERKKELERQIKKFDEDASHFKQMKERGFSQQELKHPARTGESINSRLQKTNEEIGNDLRRQGGLNKLYKDYQTFASVRESDWIPAEEAAKTEEGIQVCENKVRDFDDTVKRFEASQNAISKEVKDKSGFLGNKQRELNELIELSPSEIAFKETFKDRKLTDDLEAALYQEKNAVLSSQATAKAEFTTLRNYEEKASKFFEKIDNAPKEWLQKVEQNKVLLNASLNDLNAESIQLEKQKKQLEKSRVRASGLMLEAIEAIPETIEWQNVADVIAEQNLPKEQALKWASFFSPLLSAPAFNCKKDAIEAEKLLAQLDMHVPLFLAEELSRVIREEVIIPVQWDNDFAIGFMVGGYSNIVKAVVDPEAINTEREKIADAILRNEQEIERIQGQLNELSPDNEIVIAAKHALTFCELGGKKRYEMLEQLISSDEDKLSELNTLTAPAAFRAIIDYRKFCKLGGFKNISSLEDLILDIQDRLEELAAQLETLKVSLEQENERRDETLRLLQELKIEEANNKLFLEFQEAIDAGDFKWLVSSDKIIEKNRELAEELGRKINGINFQKAQDYLESLEGNESSAEELAKLERRIEENVGNRSTFTRQRIALEAEIEGLSRSESALDILIAELWSRYKGVRNFIASFQESEKVQPVLDKNSPLYDALDIIKTMLAEEDKPLSQQDQFIRMVHSTVDELKERDSTLERAKSSLNKANLAIASFHGKRAEIIDQKFDQSTQAGTVIERITRAKPSQIKNILAEVRFSIAKAKMEKENQQKDLDKIRKVHLTNWKSIIESGLTSHLSMLENILRDTPSTTFELKAEFVSPDQWENILIGVLDEVANIEDAAKPKSERSQKEESKHNNQLKERIADKLYSELFPRPQIYVKHKAIGGADNFLFEKDGVSQGEYASLELLWQVKLAEFSFKRDAIENLSASSLAVTPAMRRRAEKNAQGILIIDGLFSNLSDEDLIDLSLGQSSSVQSNFQIIGFLHPPHYKNNFNIFPRWLIGKPAKGAHGDGRHVWTQIETRTEQGILRKHKPGEMILTTIHGRHAVNGSNETGNADLFKGETE
ncbi:hypothetical protein [Kiloniella litopenaei]|uniref:hypothetical protein n=1 Tax=Kiloniella litopenaei TaxID=1549748 RepID=UPI003BAAA2A4